MDPDEAPGKPPYDLRAAMDFATAEGLALFDDYNRRMVGLITHYLATIAALTAERDELKRQLEDPQ